MTPLDDFLFGCVKIPVYKNKLQSISDIKVEIIGVIDKIETQLCQKVNKRMNIRRVARRSYLTDIVFF